MAATYTLRTRVEIAASHVIEGHPGKCGRLHGHNWVIEAEVAATELGPLGIGLDFYDLKSALKAVTDPLDHRHLNDLPGFTDINPTAETLAALVYRELRPRISAQGLRLTAVTIYETDRSSVRYVEN